MPVDMTSHGRHHRKTTAPPQMQPVQQSPTGAAPVDATGGEPDASPFEWECPACDTKQVSRPEQGCSNPECPTAQTAGTGTSTDPQQGPGGPDTLEDLGSRLLAAEESLPAEPPEPEYRLIEVISPIGADQLFRPPGVHQLDDDSVVTVMELAPDAILQLSGEVAEFNVAVQMHHFRKEEERKAAREPLDESLEPDERAVIEYGLDALGGQIEKVKTTSYGGQVITEETLVRLRARLGGAE